MNYGRSEEQEIERQQKKLADIKEIVSEYRDTFLDVIYSESGEHVSSYCYNMPPDNELFDPYETDDKLLTKKEIEGLKEIILNAIKCDIEEHDHETVEITKLRQKLAGKFGILISKSRRTSNHLI